MVTWLLAIWLFESPLEIVQPLSGTFAGTTTFVFESSVPESEILGLEVFINGQLAHYFEKQPFQADIDFRNFPQGKVTIRAVLSLFDGTQREAGMEGTNYPSFFEEEVNLIRIPLMIQMPGIFRRFEKNDFTVFENGREQELHLVYNQDQPLDLLVLLDLSGSMHHRIPVLRVGLFRFLDYLQPSDRIQIIGFNHEVFEICPPETDKHLVKRRLTRIEADGYTNLYGALWSGVKILGSSRMRRAVIAFTDGGHELGNKLDRYGKTEEDCVNLSREVGVPIYTMGVGTEVKPEVLERLANQTGGKFFFLNSGKSLRDAFVTVGGELRHQYLLCYQTESSFVGWHDILINLPMVPEAVLRYPKKLYFRQ